MDIEKLIEEMKWWEEECDRTNFGCQAKKTLKEAATALSTLQTENKRLKSLLGESGQDLWSKENQRADRLEAENKKLRAELTKAHEKADVRVKTNAKLIEKNSILINELEQVKRERDVAIEQLHGHCPACAHYTPNHNEGPCQFCCFEIARGTNVEINDNWKWRGPKEE